MKFLIYTEDKADSLQIRTDNRNAHLGWLKTPDNKVSLLTAGPWLDDDGVMRGSMLIVDAETKDEVEKWLLRDPYRAAGLTGKIIIKPFIWAIGAPPEA
ncbi:MAG: YciI family protein [Hellea sp.]|nr:YciI family protein [Hellea sp.]